MNKENTDSETKYPSTYHWALGIQKTHKEWLERTKPEKYPDGLTTDDYYSRLDESKRVLATQKEPKENSIEWAREIQETHKKWRNDSPRLQKYNEILGLDSEPTLELQENEGYIHSAKKDSLEWAREIQETHRQYSIRLDGAKGPIGYPDGLVMTDYFNRLTKSNKILESWSQATVATHEKFEHKLKEAKAKEELALQNPIKENMSDTSKKLAKEVDECIKEKIKDPIDWVKSDLSNYYWAQGIQRAHEKRLSLATKEFPDGLTQEEYYARLEEAKGIITAYESVKVKVEEPEGMTYEKATEIRENHKKWLEREAKSKEPTKLPNTGGVTIDGLTIQEYYDRLGEAEKHLDIYENNGIDQSVVDKAFPFNAPDHVASESPDNSDGPFIQDPSNGSNWKDGIGLYDHPMQDFARKNVGEQLDNPDLEEEIPKASEVKSTYIYQWAKEVKQAHRDWNGSSPFPEGVIQKDYFKRLAEAERIIDSEDGLRDLLPENSGDEVEAIRKTYPWFWEFVNKVAKANREPTKEVKDLLASRRKGYPRARSTKESPPNYRESFKVDNDEKETPAKKLANEVDNHYKESLKYLKQNFKKGGSRDIDSISGKIRGRASEADETVHEIMEENKPKLKVKLEKGRFDFLYKDSDLKSKLMEGISETEEASHEESIKLLVESTKEIPDRNRDDLISKWVREWITDLSLTARNSISEGDIRELETIMTARLDDFDLHDKSGTILK